jgi:glycosyltransferase involved in cell wall biosynthesis
MPDASEEKVRALYCCVRVDGTDTAAAAGQFHVAEAIKLGVFAKLQPEKGQEDIVCAVAELVRRGHDVELLLAGSEMPEYRRHLDDIVTREGLSERVHLVGHLTDPYPAMRATDIHVVCSRSESFGRTGVEGMLLAKPVVYPAGVLEYMIDGDTGLSYRGGDVADLVECLEQLIADPVRRRAIAEAGRAHAARLFSKDRFGGQVQRDLLRLRESVSATRMPASVASYVAAAEASMDGRSDRSPIRRNDPCPCGSGKRYKHCHGALV